MLAVGGHKLGSVDDRTIRITTAFSGGVGSTHEELCGALAAGVMLIGALHGRTCNGIDDSLCLQMTARYRNAFVAEFGSSTCQALRDRYGDCPWLVERASQILLEIVDESGAESDSR